MQNVFFLDFITISFRVLPIYLPCEGESMILIHVRIDILE